MRLSYDGLCSLHDRLLIRLVQGDIDVDGYIIEWDALVLFAGWSWHEVCEEIDRRWTTKNKRVQAFLC